MSSVGNKRQAVIQKRLGWSTFLARSSSGEGGERMFKGFRLPWCRQRHLPPCHPGGADQAGLIVTGRPFGTSAQRLQYRFEANVSHFKLGGFERCTDDFFSRLSAQVCSCSSCFP